MLQILEAACSPPKWAYFMALYSGGQRLQVWRMPPSWLLIKRSKSGRPRVIPMSGKVREVLRRLCGDAACGEHLFGNARTGK